MTETKDALIAGFAYDRWATELWTPIVAQIPGGDAIFQHVLDAQQIWYDRCIGREELPELPNDTGAAIAAMSRAFVDVIHLADLSAYVSYTMRSGESAFSYLGVILRHVINHGTHHRGQLRQMAENAGVDWPDTDLIIWHRNDEPYLKEFESAPH
ncbi:MAG: hypothetical protein JST40_09595 [Armatimonadetes bacterium]|nr:hypothetical protein [Armatimonadota bacterium]